MTATVRSVRVVMEAEVAKYVADMKMAGRITRDAFEEPKRAMLDTDRSLRTLSKSEIAVERDMGRLGRQARRTSLDLDGVGMSTRRVGKEIDTVSGRARVLLDLTTLLGPAFAPIGALGVPAIAGLGAVAGVTATSLVGTVVAVQGLGDAFKALEKARIEPTAENIQAARDATAEMAPEAQKLVKHLYSLRDEWVQTRKIAQAGLFPGVDRGITLLEKRLPALQDFLFEINHETGDLFERGAADLTSDRWTDFFNYLRTIGVPLLDDTATAAGDVAHGIGELFAATAPSQVDFTHWLKDTAESFDHWADRVGETKGFHEFMAYVATNGPKVADAAGAIADAVIQIAEAAAPLGGAPLEAITAISRAVADVADSDAGTPLLALAAGLTALNRAQRIGAGLGNNNFIATNYVEPLKDVRRTLPTLQQAGTYVYRLGQSSKYASEETMTARRAVGEFGRSLAPIGKGAAAMGGLAVASTGLADSIGLTNTASLALMGTIAGPWGAAVGGGVGLMLDLANSHKKAAAASNDLISTLNQETGAFTAASAAWVASQFTDAELKQFRAIGISISDVADAALHGGSAMAALADQVERGVANKWGSDEVWQQLPAWEKLQSVTADVTASQHQFQAQTQASAGALDDATRAANSFNTSLSSLSGWLDKRDAFRNYEQSIDDFTAALKRNGSSFDRNLRKGRENQEALDQIARSVAQVASQIQNPVRRDNFIRGAIGDLRALAAKSSPEARAAIRRVIAELRTLDATRANPSVTVDGSKARASIDAVQAALDRLHDKTVTIWTVRRGAGLAKAADVADAHGADGMTVPGPRQPYGDKMLILAAPGEEVISNRHGEADRFRADRAAGRIPAYASGGTVRGTLNALGNPKASPGDIGDRIANLTVRQLHQLGDAADDLGKRRLAKLGKALDKATALQEKQTSAAKDAFDAISSERAGYASDITHSLSRDIFAGGGSAFTGGYAANSIVGATRQLNAQTRDAQDMERLERILRERGVNGGALREILAGGIDRVRAAASASTSDLLAYQSAYDTAQRYTTSAANTGAALLTPAFDALKAKYDQEVAESKAIKDEIRALRAEQKERHTAEQKTRQAAPTKTASALNHGARRARRGA